MKIMYWALSVLALAATSCCAPSRGAEEVVRPSEYVSTLVGTQSDYSLSAGNTYPAIALPWGMNFWTPQTGRMGDGWTYTYGAHTLRGFKQTHQPSPWINDYGQFSVMPVRGNDKLDEESRQSWFSHQAEQARPYYYSVYLADHDVKAEVAPTERAAILRFTFPESEESGVVVDAFDRGSCVEVVDDRTIAGYTTRNSGGVPDNFRNYFILRFDKPFSGVELTDSPANYKAGSRVLYPDGGKRVEGAELTQATRTRGSFAANLSRDWKMMVRVPVFFNQFVLSSLLMPLYFIVIMVVSGAVGVSQATDAGMDPVALLEMARSLTALLTFDNPALAWCAVGVLFFGLFLGFSSYSFTMGVSRDGEDFFFLRGLPMNWSAYLAAKFVSPFALSTVPMLVLFVAAIVLLGVPAAAGTYLVAFYLGATVSLGLLSLGLGARFPRLTWDNEAQLVKGGGATLMVFAGLLVGVVVMVLPALALLAGALWNVLAVPAALGLALAIFVAECALLAWWVFGPTAAALARIER